jgi:hypothetical protein
LLDIENAKICNHASCSAFHILNPIDIDVILSGYPHGPTSLYAIILGFGSYLLATSSTFGCYLATVGFVLMDGSPRQYVDTDVSRTAVGLFSFEDKINASELSCKMYSSAQLASFDAAVTMAQAFGILANVLIGTCLIILLFLSCCSLRKPFLKFVCVLLWVGATFQALTLLIFASDALCQSCELFLGSGVAILCTVVTFINAIVIYRIPPVDEQAEGGMNRGKVAAEIFQDEEGHNESHKEMASAEINLAKDESQTGSSSIHGKRMGRLVKTIVNLDGSHTVEKSVIYE